MSNYPDDIRNYDYDPRSPFYEERDYCDVCHERADHCTCEDEPDELEDQMYNYPDDIRNYDNGPRSPFYEEPVCSVCEEFYEECTCEDEPDEPLEEL